MLAYLLQVTISLSVFYALYMTILSRETFFSVNRWYLLGSLILSLVMPLLLWLPAAIFSGSGDSVLMYAIEPVAIGFQDVSAKLSSQETLPLWMIVLLSVYWTGVAMLLYRFAAGLHTIWKMHHNGEHHDTHGYQIIYSSHPHLPFSFFQWIFLSREHALDQNELDEILRHESAHASALHSVDVLFMELACIFLWPSPAIYLYRKSLRRVHEYLADAVVLKHSSFKHYGHLLISQATSGMQLALANHFLRSQLKHRFIMMTKRQSHRLALLKYAAMIPVALVIVVLFAFRGTSYSPNIAKEAITQDSVPANKVYKVVEEMPRFPGCEDSGLTGDVLFNCAMQKMLTHVYTGLQYPSEAKTHAVEGRVVAQFIVRSDGSVEDAKILRSLGYGTDEAVLDAIKAMPKWRPGYQKGKAVDVEFTLPVAFKLDHDTKPETAQTADHEVYKVVEEMPRFPGCENQGLEEDGLRKCAFDKLIEFITEHIHYPEAAKKAGIHGKCVVQFVVHADGSISDSKIVRSLGYGTDEVVLDMMWEMPSWRPGFQDGKAVDVQFALPVSFALPAGDKKQ